VAWWRVRQVVELPLLCKDLSSPLIKLYQARAAGRLIAALADRRPILSDQGISTYLLRAAPQLDLAVLVEVHTSWKLERRCWP